MITLLVGVRGIRRELEMLSDVELEERFDAFLKARVALAEAQERARPFNQPSASANFDYWAKLTYWKVDEAIALLLGKSPTALAWENVKSLASVSPLVVSFANIREMATRAVHWKELYDPGYPGAFIMWAHRKNLPVPAELEEKVRAYGHSVGDWKLAYDQLEKVNDALARKGAADANQASASIQEQARKIATLNEAIEDLQRQLAAAQKDRPTSTRETESLRKLVIGMAVAGYRYDPHASRSEAVSEIAGDLETCGVQLDADTVRKHLKSAAELLPPADAPERNPPGKPK